MSTTLLYALIMAIGQIVLTLVGYFLGFQTDKINQGTWFGLVPLIYAIVVYSLGIKAVREENAGKYLTYGKGVGTGAMIALYSGLIGSVYAYIHFTYVNPNFTDYLIEASRVKWAAAGMSDGQMDGAEKGIRMFTKPAVQAVVGFCMTIVFGVIISLIAAAFLKRNPPEEGKVAAEKGSQPSSLSSQTSSRHVLNILHELMANPSSQLIDRFTAAVTDSKDPAVTDILLETLRNQNPGFRGIAIQSLGLVYDPRALDAAYNAYQTTKGVHDHQQRAALSIINLVSNDRDTNPAAIKYLMKIVEDDAMPTGIKTHAILALRHFRKDNIQVEEFFLKLKEHPDQEIRFAAH